jgi:hypothetical protein
VNLSNPVDRVLVIGVYMADHPNAVEHIVTEMDRSSDWRVDQRWIAIGRRPAAERLATVTVDRVDRLIPKFTLLNRALADISLADYAFVLICDDDVRLPAAFPDSYLRLVRQYDFALCQPARTHDSYIDHPFVEQFDGLTARQTRFVEIGPVVSIRHDAIPLLLPFDEQSPMGWGYDLVWPHILQSAGLKMGIIDATPVAHALRKPVTHYDHDTVRREMARYLESRAHLSLDAAFVIVEAYA